jgi:hypothetical protein
MTFDFFPFQFSIDTIAIAGSTVWALALYLSFSALAQWVTEQFQRWLNFAEQSLYTSKQEFEQTRQSREAQNAFYASLMSIMPFLGLGTFCHFALMWGLGASWAISTGIMACMGAGIYELGRRDSQSRH